MNLQLIEEKLSHDRDALDFIIEKKLIDNNQICQKNHEPVDMTIIYDNHISTKHIWRCSICKSNKTILNGSIFQDSKISIKTIIKIIYLWSYSFSGKHASQETGVSEHTIFWVYSQIEDACYEFITGEDRQKIGGSGLNVEIDEILLTKRKYHTGCLLDQIWVFGGDAEKIQLYFLKLSHIGTLIFY